MSLYGYSDALSQGSAYNARMHNYNDGIRLKNQEAMDRHKKLVEDQKGKVADDALKQKEDGAEYAVMDTKGVISSGVGIGEAYSGIAEKGVAGYITDVTRGRLNTISDTARRAVSKNPKPAPKAPTLEDTEITQDADGDPVFTSSAANATKDAENVASTTEREIESSGMGTKLIKTGLSKVVGGAVGEAGLSAVSEIGGKVLGDFSGGKDIVESFSNLANGKGFFAGDTTADKWQEAGAALDLVGTVFPPAELVGGIASLVGGAMETWDDIKADSDKKHKDAATIPPPKQTAVTVSPAFSTMGLVASAPISAKTSITGS